MVDADPRNRTNHYGSQPVDSVRGLRKELDDKQDGNPKLNAISEGELRTDAHKGQVPVFHGDDSVTFKKIGLGPGDLVTREDAERLLGDHAGGGGGGPFQPATFFAGGVGTAQIEAMRDAAQDAAVIAVDAAEDAVNAALSINSNGELTPEQYYAAGDGTTNDTSAFQALSARIQELGGGVASLRAGATYLVGRQALANAGGYMWKGEPILNLDGLTKPFILRGNGAKFKVADGLKVGTFDAAGSPTSHTLPYWGSDYSIPLKDGVVTLKNCSARVHLENFSVDGNEQNLTWGGPFGDDGWQVEGDAVFLYNNTGGHTLINVNGHRSNRDGLLFQEQATKTTEFPASTFTNCEFLYNVRQGLSLVGGKGHTYIGCKFNHTGKGAHRSSPAAGIDFEEEGGIIRNHTFINCEVMDNDGVGIIYVGDVRNIRFKGGKIVGTTTWVSYYPCPFLSFEDVLIMGKMIGLGDLAGAEAPACLPVFRGCNFTDDLTLSPTGTIYGGAVVDYLGNDPGTILFDRCAFRAGFNAGVNGTNVISGVYRECAFNFGPEASLSHLTGAVLEGDTKITIDALSGGTDLFWTAHDAKMGSRVIKNGTEMRRASVVWDPASIATGASVTLDVNIPWAYFTDKVAASFSASLQGLALSGYVKTQTSWPRDGTNGVVTVVLTNNTGGAVDLASGTLTVALSSPGLP